MGVSKVNSRRLKLFWAVSLLLTLLAVSIKGDEILTEDGEAEIQDADDIGSRSSNLTKTWAKSLLNVISSARD